LDTWTLGLDFGDARGHPVPRTGGRGRPTSLVLERPPVGAQRGRPGEPVWFQLYARDNWNETLTVLKTAKDAGCPAVAWTVGLRLPVLTRSLRPALSPLPFEEWLRWREDGGADRERGEVRTAVFDEHTVVGRAWPPRC
jgi:hypothetical protein